MIMTNADSITNRDYKDLYNKLILNKANAFVISYRQQNGKQCSYRFKHHKLETDTTDHLVKLLIDNVIFYSYSPDEIENKHIVPSLENLEALAAMAFGERLAKRYSPKTDGLVGELMLDILIQKICPNANKIFTRTKYVQQGDNSEIKGYDSAFFLKQPDGSIEMWLGQAKAGDKNYCLRGISKDINKDEKYLDRYFSKSIRYICDRTTDEVKDPDLLSIINGLNEIIFESYKSESDELYAQVSIRDRETDVTENIMKLLANKNVSIVVPCLLMFGSEIYSNPDKFNAGLDSLCDNIYGYFEDMKFKHTDKVPVKILILMLPVKDLTSIKSKICDFKKGDV